MNNLLTSCSFFLILLLLGIISEILAREIAGGASKNTEIAYSSAKRRDDDDGHLCLSHGHGCDIGKMNNYHDQYVHAHPSSSSSSSSPPPLTSPSSSSSSSSSHMELSVNLFFHIEDLKAGKKFPLYFPIKAPTKAPHFIPKEEADSLPFSLSHLPQILNFFSFSHNSPQAKAIKDTLKSCELPPIRGERKFCATSLESMLDFVKHFFGSGTNFKVLTTTQLKNWAAHLQNYTVLEDPKEMSGTRMVGCHPLPYPYALFYCHGQEEEEGGHNNKVFVVSLEGEDGVRIDAVAICHMDTSQWERNHPSFRLLGIEPGSKPVCHVLPQDSLVWVSFSSSNSK